MEVVLGVSMTPTAVRMVLVEGPGGDGVTVDAASFHPESAGRDPVTQVVAGVLGTMQSAADGGHRLVCIGVSWREHDQAARLREALYASGVEDDVVMVSELHAAGALAQAAGRRTGSDRTALMFLERDTATLAVVRTDDGAVIGVQTRSLADRDAVSELAHMIGALKEADRPPESVFVVGSGADMVTLSARIAGCSSLAVHAPDDADLALARGAALAAASVPPFEAATVGLGPAWDADLTEAGPTQMAYSAAPEPREEGEPFFLVGGALAATFVIGVAALAISLAVTIRPVAEQLPVPPRGAVLSGSVSPPAPTVAVVRQPPRTVFVQLPAAPAAPAPLPAPVPVAPPLPPAPAAPVVVAPIPAPLLPSFPPPPVIRMPRTVVVPSTTTSTATATSTTTSTATSTTTSTATSTTTSTATSTATSTTTSTATSTATVTSSASPTTTASSPPPVTSTTPAQPAA